jgi:UDP-N-acetylglucosamine--N-acetylmuramyl-(pentapeptide) pyrophosphoryl-undecaprenol N-acetylglucosamine transferase
MGKRVMILAGGTGGHVYPALAVALELIDAGHEVVWMGTHKGLEARVIPAAGIPLEWLSVAGLRGKGWRDTFKAPFMLLRALSQSKAILGRVKPDVVLGMGGFVSGPGGLMSTMMGIPLILHEQNRVPGTTNRLLAKRASAVLEAFPESFPSKVKAIATGNPLRREIASLPVRQISWAPGHPLNVLVVGGSLGAKALNEAVPEALARLGHPLNIRHQTGQAMRAETIERYGAARLAANVCAFVEDMAEAYGRADLVICRSGAMTVSELAAAGLAAILVPYPHAIDDHQTKNARYLADVGAAQLIPQAELTPESLAAVLTNLLETPGKIDVMSQKARAMAKPEATQIVAGICLDKALDTAEVGRKT